MPEHRIEPLSISEPEWCPIHQHYKWCEHNGGVMGPTGHEAPSPKEPSDD